MHMSVSVLIISVREQEQDRSELVFVVKVSGPLHSSPVVPLTPTPLISPCLLLCLSFLTVRGGELQRGGPGDTSHDSSCQSLLSITLTD